MILLINEQRDRLREALLCHILQGNNISIEEAELEGVGLHFGRPKICTVEDEFPGPTGSRSRFQPNLRAGLKRKMASR